MPTAKDFETLYSTDPGKIRANANLPGHLVLTVTRFTNHAEYLEQMRKALQDANPGYDEKHYHTDACNAPGNFSERLRGASGDLVCGKWCWKDWGIPESFNPVREFITPYQQSSRAEAMKGSEQVVRSFQGVGNMDIDGAGSAPDLAPRLRKPQDKPNLVVVATNGIHEAKGVRDQAKGLVGLGGR